MTSVRLNSTGIDIVELKLETTGSNFCHFTAHDNLLNSDLEYIFGVTDLNCDVSNLPIFPPATDDLLISIKKRYIGAQYGALPVANGPETSQRFRISEDGKKYFDTTTFVAALSTFANTFSHFQSTIGIVGADHGGGPDIPPNTLLPNKTLLKIGITSGGRLQFEGIAEFWNHFVIEFSDYAIKLFQLSNVAVNNSLSISFAGGVYTTNGLTDNGGNVVAGNNVTDTAVIAKNSVLKFLDHRLYLTCETHLAIKNNLKVVNGKEQTDATIARIPFLNEAVSTIYSRHHEIVNDIALTTKTYTGRISFVNKSQPVRQWVELITAYEQRIFRFQLFCVYNVFANGTFSQVKKDVPFDEDGSWDLTLRFVNKI